MASQHQNRNQQQNEVIHLPPWDARTKAWVFSPPGRRSETLGDLIENYNILLREDYKHAKAMADAWARAEAEEIVSHSPHRHYWTAFVALRRAGKWIGRVFMLR